jgi:hypothetical protein
MSGLTLGDIRNALAATITNGVSRQTNVYAYPVGDPKFPAITIEPDSGDYVDYWLTFGAAGLAAVRLVLVLEPGGNDPVSAGIALDDYLSAGTGNGSSVIDAVLADRTLGLAGCDCVITSATVDATTITARLSVSVTVNKIGAAA